MISLDISILYQIVIFLVLWLMLSKVLFQPYLALFEERERKISGTRHDTSQLEHEGAGLKAEYEEKITQARRAGITARDAIIREGQQARERLLQQAREEAARTLEGARRDVQSQLELEREQAAAAVAGVAQDMVSKVLGRRVG